METFDTRFLPFLTREMLAAPERLQFRMRLRTRASNSVVFIITGTTRDGQFTFKHIPIETGALETTFFALSDIPISLSVQDQNGNFPMSSGYFELALEINETVVQQLMSGYIGSGQSYSWPNAAAAIPIPVIGELVNFGGTDPAANVEISEIVPDFFAWKIKSIRFRLVTDATAATRTVHLTITLPSSVVMDIPSVVTQTASLTRDYNFIAGLQSYAAVAGDEIVVGLPDDLILPANSTIATATDNRQATDNFAAPRIFLERYMINNIA